MIPVVSGTPYPPFDTSASNFRAAAWFTSPSTSDAYYARTDKDQDGLGSSLGVLFQESVFSLAQNSFYHLHVTSSMLHSPCDIRVAEQPVTGYEPSAN